MRSSKFTFGTLAMLFVLALGHSSSTWALSGALSQMATDLKDAYKVSSPTSHFDQGRGFASGGGIRVRFKPAPMLGVKLWEVKAPSFSASCSGVDLHLGSLSLIDKQQLLDLVQQLPGMAIYLTYLALKKFCPGCASVLAQLQDLINRFGQATFGRCEDALEDFMGDEPWGLNMNTATNFVMEKFSGKDPSSDDAGEVSPDGAAASVVKANLVYKHFVENGFKARILPSFSDEDIINLAQSMTGTILVEPKTVNGETTFGIPKPIPPASLEDLSLRSLLEGGDIRGNVCQSTADYCFSVKVKEPITTIDPADSWSSVVFQLLDPADDNSLINKLRVHRDYNSADPNTQLTTDEKEIISAIPGPVMALARNMAVNNTRLGTDTTQAIAYDLAADAAYEFLLDITSEAMIGLTGIDEESPDVYEALSKNVARLQGELRAEYRALKEANQEKLKGSLEMIRTIELLRSGRGN